jgi:anti-anti-sigma factor
MADFAARTSGGPDQVVVALVGECDLSVREDLTSALLAAVGQAPRVVVDLSDLTFLDSSGVHALLIAHQAAGARGGQVSVVHARGVVADVLDLTGLGELLAPRPTPERGDA